MSLTVSRTKEIFKAVLCIAGAFVLGGALVWHGWSGLTEGQIVIHLKDGTTYMAHPVGPTAVAFNLKVRCLLIVGAMFLAGGVTLAIFLLTSGKRRDQALHRLASHDFRSGRSKVPRWLVIMVLVVLFAFLAYAAWKRHLTLPSSGQLPVAAHVER